MITAFTRRTYFFRGACANALAAADFDAGLVRPSRKTFDAADALEADVCFAGEDACDSALAAADLEAAPVFGLLRVFDAAVAAFGLVVLLFDI